MRPARVDVDLSAIAHNVGELRRRAAPALLCAVVKADGYGHGAVEVSRAALAAGAHALAVALPVEGAELREAGIDAPVLMLSEAAGGVGRHGRRQSTSSPRSTPRPQWPNSAAPCSVAATCAASDRCPCT